MKKKSGQSLVEILVAITIGGIIVGSATVAIVLALQSGKQNKLLSTALPLAQELMDKARAVAEAKWTDLYTQTHGVDSYIVLDGGLKIVSGAEGALSNDITNGLVGYWKFDEAGGQGDNLVTNGDGSSGNNTNFTSFTYEPADSYDAGAGSFKTSALATTNTTNALMPVDPSQAYKIKGAIKLLAGTGTWNYYFGVAPYDRKGLNISNNHVNQVSGSAKTTLAANLNPNDTTITLTSSAGWHNGSTSHMRSINFYPYIDSDGFTYADYGYSRLVRSNVWGSGGITGNVITLSAPWSGPAYSAGTKVANAQSGSGYMYTAASNQSTPTVWTVKEGTINGTAPIGTAPSDKFWQGTASVKALWLLNRDNTGSVTTAVDAVSFERIETGGAPITDTYDSSFNGNKGILLPSSNGPIRIDSSGCKISACLRFDGSDDYVDLPNLSYGNDVTFLTWFKGGSQTASAWNYFIRSGSARFEFGTWGNSLIFKDNGLAGTPTVAAGTAFTDNNWHQAVGIIRGTVMEIWVDGVLRDSRSDYPGGQSHTNVDHRIGGEGGASGWGGLLDDVRIYNRALSAAEALQLYGSTPYTRAITIENVSRDGSGSIVTTGGMDDPSTQKITARVVWPGSTSGISIVEYFSRIRNEVDIISDWASGSFSSSTGIDNTTAGELKLWPVP